MKKFGNLVLMNFKRVLMPIIITALSAVGVQVLMYIILLTSGAAYEKYASFGGMEYVESNPTAAICTQPIAFMKDNDIWVWNIVGLISIIVAIMLNIFKGRESEQNNSVLRTLPVSRFKLWAAKFVQVFLSLAFVYCANYAAMFINYGIYSALVHENFRKIFIFDWNNTVTETFFTELTVFLIIALVISIVYSVKKYSLETPKTKKGVK